MVSKEAEMGGLGAVGGVSRGASVGPVPACALFTVNCGWSAWSPWGECLGPCGVQSIQWSFRSPNNPSKHGNGRQCRGIYRKARR